MKLYISEYGSSGCTICLAESLEDAIRLINDNENIRRSDSREYIKTINLEETCEYCGQLRPLTQFTCTKSPSEFKNHKFSSVKSGILHENFGDTLPKDL